MNAYQSGKGCKGTLRKQDSGVPSLVRLCLGVLLQRVVSYKVSGAGDAVMSASAWRVLV